MGTEQKKPHAVCIPYPAQGHVTPMLKLAKLLHSRAGFHVTFVNTEYNHGRLLRARGPGALDGLPGFRFAAIPDGLSADDCGDSTQDIPSLCRATMTNCLPHAKKLLAELNAPDSGVPPVTCVVSDGVMTFGIDAAREIGVPCALLWTASACGFMGYWNFRLLIERGVAPVPDAEQTSGYLETPVEWAPGMSKHMRLKDFPSFIRTTQPDDRTMVHFKIHETGRATLASAFIINTFDDFERPALDAMAALLQPPIYTVGPLLLLGQRAALDDAQLGSNLWKEDASCLQWLQARKPGSVVYVNFGSIAVMTSEQLVEFAWGLANSGYDFLWIIRPDAVRGDGAMLPPEFLEATEERGLLASWCPQAEVLRQEAVGVFLTHSGWNSTLESICGGVPVLSWPFFAEQQTNCRYACAEWGVGMEIGDDVRREVVEGMIREVMEGEKAKEMKAKAMAWKESAVRATQPGGSSFVNFERLLSEVLLRN